MSKRKRNADRHALRTAKHERKRQEAALRNVLSGAASAYGRALYEGWKIAECFRRGIDACRVVCDGCGLEQEYLTANHFEDEFDVYPCPGVLDLGCGSLLCVSAEGWREAVPQIP